MSKAKAEYEDTKYALTAKQPLKTTINQLTKISIKTEDANLKGLIAPVLVKFGAALNVIEVKKGAIRRVSILTTDNDITGVLMYCDSCIKSVKPQWQIIAEQEGWAPRS